MLTPFLRWAACIAILSVCLVSSTARGQSSAPAATQPLPQPLPDHPRLLLDRQDLGALEQKIAGPFAQRWQAFRTAADRALAEQINLPPRGGNWSHNYVCPVHGTRLKLGKQIGPWQWEHICPTGPHTLRGDPSRATLDFDGNAIASIHGRYANQIVDMGVVYQVTHEAKYADRARDILRAYAQQYLTYPLHDNQGKPRAGGRVASQSLTEATWLISVAQGADLVWETLSEDDRRAIADRLLRPALEQVIIPANHGIHNIQCRQNSAIGLVGFLLDDRRLIHLAIDDPKSGFRQQIARGVLDDGMWREGSFGYHFFTLEGLWPLAEAARHCGIDLYTDRYKSMYDAPLAMSMPDLRLPNFNDSNSADLESLGDVYELAYARWRDPKYVPMMLRGDRAGRLALFYGAAELPREPQSALARGSRNRVPSGYAILEQGAGRDATWLCLKYGPYGGGHGHFDKNHFILYAHGGVLMPDAGTHAYGSPLHARWDKHSLAHNTLVVDEKSQAGADGKCLAFGSRDGVGYAAADAGDIYPDKHVRFVRNVFMLDPDHIVLIDQVHAGAPATLDLAMHVNGKWTDLPPGAEWHAPRGAGYDQLEGLTSRTSDGIELRVEPTSKGARRTCITLEASEPTEVITGTGIGASTEDHVPIAILRRRAAATTYVWSISLDGTPTRLQLLPSSSGGTTVRVTTATRRVTLTTPPPSDANGRISIDSTK